MMYYTMKKINTVPNLFELTVEDTEGNENGYIYVSMEVYNAAVCLHDRFEGDIEAVANRLIKNVSIPEDLQAAIDIMPEPLDILVPYVLLCKNGFKDATLENVCGALTIMSRSISFKQFIVVPETVRSGVSFTRHTLSQYKDVWDMVFKNVTIVDLDTYTKDFITSLATEILSGIPQQPVQVIQPQSIVQQSIPMQPQPSMPAVEQNYNTSMYDSVEPNKTVNNDSTPIGADEDDVVDFASMFDELFDEEEKKVEEEKAKNGTNTTVAGEALIKEASDKLDMKSKEDRELFDVVKFYSRSGGVK